MFKYLGLPPIVPDVTFGVFLLAWVATRHILYNCTIYSVLYVLPKHIAYRWEPEAGYFWSPLSRTIFCSLLIGLQVILCIWLFMIIRVVIKVLNGVSADDIRSDDE